MAITKTLAELNANPSRYQWGEYTVEQTYAVGGMGRSFSQYHSGAKFHLLYVSTVVARDEEAIAAKKAANPKYTAPLRVGAVFSCRALCNGNGQHTGILARGADFDTNRVNCKNCGA